MVYVTVEDTFADIPVGWQPHVRLAWTIAHDAGAVVLQVKRKFHELRVYTTPVPTATATALHLVTQDAATRCYWCGAEGMPGIHKHEPVRWCVPCWERLRCE